MDEAPAWVVVKAFTGVLGPSWRRPALRSAGIDARVSDDHLVSMAWHYSNAIGGVSLLVRAEQIDEARQILAVEAQVGPEDAAALGNPSPVASADLCASCGGNVFDSNLRGRHLAVFSWLAIGVPVFPVARSRYCRRCGTPVSKAEHSA